MDAFESVGISMSKIADGSKQLKAPIELLKELSAAFIKLPEDDIKRANILTNIGGEKHTNTLSQLRLLHRRPLISLRVNYAALRIVRSKLEQE